MLSLGRFQRETSRTAPHATSACLVSLISRPSAWRRRPSMHRRDSDASVDESRAVRVSTNFGYYSTIAFTFQLSGRAVVTGSCPSFSPPPPASSCLRLFFQPFRGFNIPIARWLSSTYIDDFLPQKKTKTKNWASVRERPKPPLV